MIEFVKYIKPILDLFISLLSPIIAVIVAYIAYQQWKTNKDKSNREKRQSIINIYLHIKEFLRFVDLNRKVSPELYDKFQKACAEADFICDKKLIDWLEDIDTDASSWLDLNRIINLSLQSERPITIQKNIADLEKMIDKLQNAHIELINKFNEQMNLIK